MTEYDAIVIGAGATGGVAAQTLAARGLSVLVLDAGPQLNPEVVSQGKIWQGLQRAWNLATQRQSYQALHPGYWKANPRLFVNEQENPYVTPNDRPFYWIRGRQVGGRSLTWGGITLRLSDYEFQAAALDGYGHPWPIAHQDLAPYYAQLERFFQVQGNRDGLPQLPDGEYTAVPNLTPAEQYLQSLVNQSDRSDRSLIVSRGFGLHRQAGTWPRSSSLGSTLQAALATGNVTLQPDAVVSHLIFNPQTRQAQGVEYVHRVQKTLHGVRGKLIVFCASTIETLRILLHSTEQHQPGGLVNESGLLGRNLMDHVSTMQFFSLPSFSQPTPAFDLSGCDSFFIPRFCNLKQGQSEDFLRGYGLWGGIQRVDIPPLLSQVGQDAIGFLVGCGEVLPHSENQVTLSPDRRDAWGIPIAHIDFSWRENEQRMLVHIQDQIQDLIHSAGGRPLHLTELLRAPLLSGLLNRIEERSMTAARPGYYIHEVGGAPMGTSPQHSVVNPLNQCWEAPNVLVVDGACWPSSGWQNPTLTEMAITARACQWVNLR